MRKRLFFLLLIPIVARADLKWASTTVYTTGAPSDGPATAQFTFTNTGNYPIKIMGARTTCGCTAAVADDKPVPPGQTGKIDVSFKTLNRHGLYEEPIIVDTNDPSNPSTKVTLRVMVEDAVTLMPTLLFWQAGEPLNPKIIEIDVTEGYNVKDIDASCSNPDVQIHLDTVKPGAEYKLTVTPKAAHVRATISITPHGPNGPMRRLTAHVRVV